MSNNHDKQNTKWLGWLIALVVVIAIILICWFLFRGKETYISEAYESEKTEAIECENSSPSDAFFNYPNTESVSHTIKSTFRDNKLKKIFYNYDATFGSDSVANTANATLHGQYNKYMAEKSLNPDSLKPTFSNSGNTVKIALISDIDRLVGDNITFFFLDMDDFQRIKSYTPKELATIYNKKGFSCKTYE